MYITKLPYHENSATLFSGIAEERWAIFIDSCWPNAKQGRFDIIAANPARTFITEGHKTTITTENASIFSERDPFLLLERYLAQNSRYRENDKPFSLPFYGGAIGYFGYDLARCLEKLPQKSPKEPVIPDMMIGIYEDVIVVDHQERATFLITPKKNRSSLPLWIEKIVNLSHNPSTLLQAASFSLLSPFISNMDKDQYKRAFNRIMKYIHDGDCYQINLTQRFSAPFRGSTWLAYQRIRQKNPAPYSAYLNFPATTVMSHSPECFIRSRDRMVETKPIKGTRPRNPNDPAVDQNYCHALINSEKDRAENLMIVDLLRNDLGKSCKIGSIAVPHLFSVESFATVHHLVSTVIGELAENKSSIALLRGAFPGGSITGTPKVRAMEIIEELEPHPRNTYCGSIGYIGFNGDMDCNIAIRTLYTNGTEKNDPETRMIYCSAGGGLVADSKVDSEYQETFDKVKIILDNLEGSILREVII